MANKRTGDVYRLPGVGRVRKTKEGIQGLDPAPTPGPKLRSGQSQLPPVKERRERITQGYEAERKRSGRDNLFKGTKTEARSIQAMAKARLFAQAVAEVEEMNRAEQARVQQLIEEERRANAARDPRPNFGPGSKRGW